jgi:site-specific recombinase XerD
MNFDLAIEEFRRYLKQNYDSKNTQECYIKGVKNTLKDKNLDTLIQRDLDDISIALKDKNLKPNTIRVRHAAINLFCKEILKREDLHLKVSWQEPTIKDVLTHEQTERVLEIAKTKSKTDYAVVMTLNDGALRKSEVCNLNLDDVRFDTLELYIRDSKTGNNIVTMTTRVADAIKDYILYERQPINDNEQALFISKRGKRIGEHFVRNHVKECAAEAGITTRVYPHLFKASSITHLLNEGINPKSVQQHARHAHLSQTMQYNRPTQQQMKCDIERVFVKKDNLDDKDRIRATVDKYHKGEITKDELLALLDVLRPKPLKHEGELRGYQ